MELVFGPLEIIWVAPELVRLHSCFRAVSVSVEGLSRHGLVSSIDCDSFVAELIIGQPLTSAKVSDFIIAGLLEASDCGELGSWLPVILFEISLSNCIEWMLEGIIKLKNWWHIIKV